MKTTEIRKKRNSGCSFSKYEHFYFSRFNIRNFQKKLIQTILYKKEKKIIIKYKFSPVEYTTSYIHPPTQTILAHTPREKRLNSIEVNFVLITTLYALYSCLYYKANQFVLFLAKKRIFLLYTKRRSLTATPFPNIIFDNN